MDAMLMLIVPGVLLLAIAVDIGAVIGWVRRRWS
jgi:hypothetical protein